MLLCNVLVLFFWLFCVNGFMLASQLRQDEDGASAQRVLLLRFTGPNLSAGTSSAMLSAAGVSHPAY